MALEVGDFLDAARNGLDKGAEAERAVIHAEHQVIARDLEAVGQRIGRTFTGINERPLRTLKNVVYDAPKAVVTAPFKMAGKVAKWGAIGGIAVAAAALLPSMGFGKKKGANEAKIDAVSESLNNDQLLTAEQALPALPPLQMSAPAMMPMNAMGGDGVSLMDNSPMPTSKVAQLAAGNMPGSYADKRNAQLQAATGRELS